MPQSCLSDIKNIIEHTKKVDAFVKMLICIV